MKRIENTIYAFTLIEILVIIAVIALSLAILFPVFTRSRGPHDRSSCSYRLRGISASILIYVQEHEEILPKTSEIWKKIDIDKNTLHCPQDKTGAVNSYLYNNNISGIASGDIVDPTIKMVAVDGATTISAKRKYNNIYYTPQDVIYRHPNNNAIVVYLDGHSAAVNEITEPESWDKPEKVKKEKKIENK